MGNEMGNNNTSELREEEDNKSTETENSKEENNIVRAPEDNGKEAGIAADDDDPKATIHANGKESEQMLIEESSIATEFQITNPLQEQLEDQIGNESLFEKEEAEDCAEQVEVVQSKQEELDILKPNIAFGVEEKIRELDNHISDTTKESAAFELAFQEDSRPTDEKFGVENGDGVVEARILKENDDAQFSIFEETELVANKSRNGDSEHADGDSNSEVDAASNSPEPKENPDGENGERENPDKNGILQAEEMNSVHRHEIFQHEPSVENGIHCECASSEGTIAMDRELVNLKENISIKNGEYEEKESVKEQTSEIEEDTEELVRAEDQLPITVSENEGDQVCIESKPEGKLESSNSELLETEVLRFNVQSTSVPAVELPIEKPHEAEAIQFRESESIGGNIALVREIHSKQESEDNKSIKDEQSLEISEKTEAPEFGEAFKPSFSALLFHPEDQLQKTATYTEDAQVLKYLTSGSKLKTGSEFLEAEAESEKPEITEAYKPSFPVSLLHPDDQQQKTATNREDNPAFDHSTSEVKLESNTRFLREPSSPFYTLMETKPEEAETISVQTLETPKILTEATPSDSEDLSKKSRNGLVPEILTGKRKEDEQTLEIEVKSKASEFAEEYKPSFPDSLLYSEDQRQKTAADCKDDRVFGVSTSEVKLEINSELTSVPTVDLPIEKPEETETPKILTESDPSGSENHSRKSCNGPIPDISSEELKENLTDVRLPGSNGESKKQTEKVKALTPDNKEQETTARFSMELNPDSYAAQLEMRKSPSFGPDLRIEAAKTKESDQTPLLYHSKSTNEQDVMNFQASLKQSDSEKSKPPFPPEPKQQDRQVSAKKDKHRHRSSLFTNCMCCTTVLN